jgi:hypothetical protein
MSQPGKLKALGRRLFQPITYRLSVIEQRLEQVQLVTERSWYYEKQLQQIREALGRIEDRQLETSGQTKLSDHEYRVFSQWGEDGIIQFLLRHIEIDRKTFVEFGVGDYTEANTRFLLVNNNWTGLVMDSSADNIESIRRSPLCWGYGLKAAQSFITTDNINRLLEEHGMTGEIGLLSIDIDGNDYWIWRAIEAINPVIVITEYNHRFGNEAAVTIPYHESFERAKAQPLIYFGASLKALCLLANRKGYAFVGCNSNGVNAFFVRRDKLPQALKELSPSEGYVAGKFNEEQDEEGRYILRSPEEDRLRLMSLPLVNVEDGEATTE